MIQVIAEPCVEEYAADCVYGGQRMLRIHLDECADCGAGEPVCPVEAICCEGGLPYRWRGHTDGNAWFFTGPLPGRGEPLGSPRSGARLGVVGAGTPLAGFPLSGERAEPAGLIPVLWPGMDSGCVLRRTR